VRDKYQFAKLARQVYSEDNNGLYESYLDATRTLHVYLIDFAQDTDERLRFRTHIFPTGVTVIYAAVGYEKVTVEFSPLTNARQRRHD